MRNFRRIFGFLLIIIGIGIMMNVAYKKVVTLHKQNELLDAFENEIQEVNNNNDNSNESKEELKFDSINGYTPIAILEIPSIKLKQPVVDGVTQDAIKYFLGRFKEGVMPGEVGNFSVAGHNVSSYADAFTNLHKVAIGDKVIVTTKEGRFTYEIDDSFIISPTQVEVLNNTDYEKITLITCTADSKSRVVVTGKLIGREDF